MTERHALPRFLGPALAPLACVAFCVTAGCLSIVGGLVLVGGYCQASPSREMGPRMMAMARILLLSLVTLLAFSVH
jgi:hypothetical protein